VSEGVLFIVHIFRGNLGYGDLDTIAEPGTEGIGFGCSCEVLLYVFCVLGFLFNCLLEI